jgi:inward rectifier potassium channel
MQGAAWKILADPVSSSPSEEHRMSTQPVGANREEEPRDLGFGSVVTQESRARLLNRDGSFNVERRGLGFWSSLSLYQALLTMSWWKYLGLVSIAYLVTNLVFATAYLACGPGAMAGALAMPVPHFVLAFFFSVQTLATIGYGHVHPVGVPANLLVTVESLVGLLGFALATGMMFARFSRPTARVVFSKRAVIAPYRGITAFEFRVTNARRNELIELEAKVLFSCWEEEQGRSVRRFYSLPLERSRVTFFPLSWTIVHPIDETSPLASMTPERLRALDAEFLILLSGVDETFAQTVHSRSSYKSQELVWNARFADIYERSSRGPLAIDASRLDAIVPS